MTVEQMISMYMFDKVYRNGRNRIHDFTVESIMPKEEKRVYGHMKQKNIHKYTHLLESYDRYVYSVISRCKRCGSKKKTLVEIRHFRVTSKISIHVISSKWIYVSDNFCENKNYIPSDDEWKEWVNIAVKVIEKLYKNRQWWWKNIAFPLTEKKMLCLVTSTIYYWKQKENILIDRRYVKQKIPFYTSNPCQITYREPAEKIIPYILKEAEDYDD